MAWENASLLQTSRRPLSLWMESCLLWIQDTANLRYTLLFQKVWRSQVFPSMMLSSCFCFHPIRFSIHVLEWMLCRFFPSARLMPTSVLVEQVVLDRASVTGKLSLSNLFIFNFYYAEAPQPSCPVSADLKHYLKPCCQIFLKPDFCMNAT